MSLRLICLDIFAWGAAIILGVLIGDSLEPSRTLRVVILVGLATMFQVGVGFIHGLYTRRRVYESFRGEACTAGAVAVVTTALLAVADRRSVYLFDSSLAVVAIGLLALLFMCSLRLLRYAITREKEIEKPPAICLDRALEVAEGVIADLSACDSVSRSCLVGSLRRMRESVSDIDIVVASKSTEKTINEIRSNQIGQIVKTRSEGESKITLLIQDNLKIEITIVSPDVFGAAVMSRSGTKAHDRKVRRVALKRGFKFASGPKDKNYWLYRFTSTSRATLESASEEAIYRRLRMQWIPPVLREDRGEVEAALRHQLPKIIEESDIRGDLHSGPISVERMHEFRRLLSTAAARGHEYFSLTLAIDEARTDSFGFLRSEIRKLKAEFADRIAVLEGLELSIRSHAAFDVPDEVLNSFDVVVASICHEAAESTEVVTKWLLTAANHPRIHVIANATGRRVGKRDASLIDFDAVCHAAGNRGAILEIDGRPDRLDLPEDYVRRAKTHGIRFVISAHASRTNDMANLRYGVATGQRGWATPEDVVNTWPFDRLKHILIQMKETGCDGPAKTL